MGGWDDEMIEIKTPNSNQLILYAVLSIMTNAEEIFRPKKRVSRTLLVACKCVFTFGFSLIEN